MLMQRINKLGSISYRKKIILQGIHRKNLAVILA
jgi:hypothetical protein